MKVIELQKLLSMQPADAEIVAPSRGSGYHPVEFVAAVTLWNNSPYRLGFVGPHHVFLPDEEEADDNELITGIIISCAFDMLDEDTQNDIRYRRIDDEHDS